MGLFNDPAGNRFINPTGSSIPTSVEGLLGLGPHPSVGMQNTNVAEDLLNQQASLYNESTPLQALESYANDPNMQSSTLFGKGGTGARMTKENGGKGQEFMNALATGPLTGSKFATEQVQNNPILGQLFGQQGLIGKEIGKEQQLQNQGFNLTPEDQTMYGQMSGDIARQFGQQGNQMANDLASRGLSSSGAAGAGFSGLAGNQNEMLSKAQQQIAQQRYQNTMGQIKQQQDFINQLGGQGATAINQQYGRQSSGVDTQRGALTAAANAALNQNQQVNSSGLAAANFEQANKPKNVVDIAEGAIGAAAGGFGKGLGQKAAI